MRWTAGLMVALLACLQTTSFAQSNPVYIQFSPRPVKAVLYRPDSGPAPHVAILTIHRIGSVLGAPWVLHLSYSKMNGPIVSCQLPSGSIVSQHG